MAQRAAQLASNPQIAKLLQEPHLLQQVVSSDPHLNRLVGDAPEIMRLLHPDKLQQVLHLAQDPAKLVAGAAEPLVDGDLSAIRKVRRAVTGRGGQVRNLPNMMFLHCLAEPDAAAGVYAAGAGSGLGFTVRCRRGYCWDAGGLRGRPWTRQDLSLEPLACH